MRRGFTVDIFIGDQSFTEIPVLRKGFKLTERVGAKGVHATQTFDCSIMDKACIAAFQSNSHEKVYLNLYRGKEWIFQGLCDSGYDIDLDRAGVLALALHAKDFSVLMEKTAIITPPNPAPGYFPVEPQSFGYESPIGDVMSSLIDKGLNGDIIHENVTTQPPFAWGDNWLVYLRSAISRVDSVKFSDGMKLNELLSDLGREMGVSYRFIPGKVEYLPLGPNHFEYKSVGGGDKKLTLQPHRFPIPECRVFNAFQMQRPSSVREGLDISYKTRNTAPGFSLIKLKETIHIPRQKEISEPEEKVWRVYLWPERTKDGIQWVHKEKAPRNYFTIDTSSISDLDKLISAFDVKANINWGYPHNESNPGGELHVEPFFAGGMVLDFDESWFNMYLESNSYNSGNLQIEGTVDCGSVQYLSKSVKSQSSYTLNPESIKIKTFLDLFSILTFKEEYEKRQRSLQYTYSFTSPQILIPGTFVDLIEEHAVGVKARVRILEKVMSDTTGLFKYRAEGAEGVLPSSIPIVPNERQLPQSRAMTMAAAPVTVSTHPHGIGFDILSGYDWTVKNADIFIASYEPEIKLSGFYTMSQAEKNDDWHRKCTWEVNGAIVYNWETSQSLMLTSPLVWEGMNTIAYYYDGQYGREVSSRRIYVFKDAGGYVKIEFGVSENGRAPDDEEMWMMKGSFIMFQGKFMFDSKADLWKPMTPAEYAAADKTNLWMRVSMDGGLHWNYRKC